MTFTVNLNESSAAILVARHAREKLAAFMIAHGYNPGHGDTIEDLLKELGNEIAWARDSMEILRRAMVDYRGAAHTLATYGLRASAKDALESADYIEAFLKAKGKIT